MQYKTDRIKEDWLNGEPPAGRKKAFIMLREFVGMLDRLSILLGLGELVLTDFLRPINSGKPSYHPVWQAVDIRIKDKPNAWKWAFYSIGVIISKLNWRFQIFPHFESWDEPDESPNSKKHFHVAIRIGEKE